MSKVHYLEIVTPHLESTCASYEAMLDLRFGAPVADLGQARTAQSPDGTLIGIRKPMADHEDPIIRHYVEVKDIEAATKAAQAAGAILAYAPTKQGDCGTFAIVIQDGLQHGLWQS